MNNLMIDIETLSTAKNAAILSIGAVFFDIETGEMGTSFYTPVTKESCIELDLDVNAETIAWWENQSEAAREVLSGKGAIHLKTALHFFADFINAQCQDKAVVWGNGPSFDCAILSSAFDAVNVKLPWRYSKERCVRTMVELGRTLLNKDYKNDQFNGIAHNALADAQHQARYVSKIYRGLLDLRTKSAEVDNG